MRSPTGAAASVRTLIGTRWVTTRPVPATVCDFARRPRPRLLRQGKLENTVVLAQSSKQEKKLRFAGPKRSFLLPRAPHDAINVPARLGPCSVGATVGDAGARLPRAFTTGLQQDQLLLRVGCMLKWYLALRAIKVRTFAASWRLNSTFAWGRLLPPARLWHAHRASPGPARSNTSYCWPVRRASNTERREPIGAVRSGNCSAAHPAVIPPR